MNITEFLNKSYTSYHATANAASMLDAAGFKRFSRGDGTKIEHGSKYYCTVNDSAFIAFTVGDNSGLNIACAHTDSPCLKVKGNKLSDTPEGKLINVEVYGGLLLYSMLDIPLKIAGRAFVKNVDGVECKLVCSDFNVNIPSLCIHHSDKDAGLKLNPQTDMLPLIGATDDIYAALHLENVLDSAVLGEILIYKLAENETEREAFGTEDLKGAVYNYLTKLLGVKINKFFATVAEDYYAVKNLDLSEVTAGIEGGQIVLCVLGFRAEIDIAENIEALSASLFDYLFSWMNDLWKSAKSFAGYGSDPRDQVEEDPVKIKEDIEIRKNRLVHMEWRYEDYINSVTNKET